MNSIVVDFYTSVQASVFLTGQNVKLMGYPTYSPELAFCSST